MKRAHWAIAREHHDEILERIEKGDTLNEIARDLDVKRRYLCDYFELPVNVEAYARSRVRSASAYAESIREIADSVDPEVPKLIKAKIRIQARQWLAKHLDKARYGDQPQQSTVFNLAAIHADVVRRRSATVNAVPELTAEAAEVPEPAASAATREIPRIATSPLPWNETTSEQ